jgi:hypothetical protein
MLVTITPVSRMDEMQDMSALQREGFVEALAVSSARIGELEQDAVDRRGDADESDLLDGYERGANSYVRKPADFTAFADAVRQLGLYWLVLNESPPEPRSP